MPNRDLPLESSIVRAVPTISPIIDQFTSHAEPVVWVALGDSYTAAPGTGRFDPRHPECLQGRGSYAWQLRNDFPFLSRANPQRVEENSIRFIACTGYTTIDVIEKTFRVLPTLEARDGLDFMVMTLGGNDVGFGEITKFCLFYSQLRHWRDCQKAKARAWSIIKGQDLEDQMFEVYNGIFNNMYNTNRHQLYHIFYPTFFDTKPGSGWCNIWSFFPAGLIGGALLTNKRRTELNDITEALNARLFQIADNYRNMVMLARISPQRLITLDPNLFWDGTHDVDLFRGHRFCDSEGPHYLGNPEQWFFAFNRGELSQAETSSATSKREVEGTPVAPVVNSTNSTNVAFTGQITNETTVGKLPEWLTKTFHPTPAGFEMIKWALQVELKRNRPQIHP